MNLKRFTARTSREALALVRQAFGKDAVVMSTRACPEGVEVLAMAPESLQDLEKVSAPAAPPARRMQDEVAPARRLLDDGAPARTPHDLSLAPGTHTVRVQYNTGGEESLRVDLRPGEVRPLAFRRGW